MLLQYAWRGFWRRRTRSVLVVAGIALSIALLVAVLTITRSVEGAIASALSAAGADMVVQKRSDVCPFRLVKLPRDLAAIDASVVDRLREHKGVAEATGVLELWAFAFVEPEGGDVQSQMNLPFTGEARDSDEPEIPGPQGTAQPPMMIGPDGKMKALAPTVVAGIDPAKKTIGPARMGPHEGADDDGKCCAIVDGRYLTTSDRFHTMLAVDYARARGLEVGDTIPLGPSHEFEVVGLVDLSGAARIAGAEAFIPLTVAQEMLGEGEVVDTIFLSLESRDAVEPVADYARELIGPGTSITTENDVEAGTAALASVTRNTLVAISLFVLAFAGLLLIRSAMDSVAQRVDEIGLMKAIGWRNSDVARLFVAEGAYAALIGGLIGSALGAVAGWAYGQVASLQLPASLNYYPPCSTTEAPLLLSVSTGPSPGLLLLGVAIALVIGTLAGFAASRRAAALDPSEALRRA